MITGDEAFGLVGLCFLIAMVIIGVGYGVMDFRRFIEVTDNPLGERARKQEQDAAVREMREAGGKIK
jgi:hypothetical protein